jgi:LDH2 family malate/lactate/ureidoglycolate dehydrogenase
LQVHAPEALERLVAGVLQAAGSPEAAARTVAESLVLANLRGVDSHGIIRLPQYVDGIEAGVIRPAAGPTIETRGAIAVVSGNGGFGQVAARTASGHACTLAREHGIGLATLGRVHHIGRLGEYVELAAASGCVAIAFCNTGPPGGRVAPFGGAGRLLGTNPIAYAFPGGLVADFSTSATSEGRVRAAQQAGAQVPEGWILDAEGAPSTDPGDLYAGGAILPAGGQRGTALALLAELLCGVLGGTGTASTGDDPGNGLVLLAIDGGALRPLPELAEGAELVLGALRAVRPATGVDRVLAPGDLERETETRRSAHGIPVPEGTWRAVLAVAERYGVGLRPEA